MSWRKPSKLLAVCRLLVVVGADGEEHDQRRVVLGSKRAEKIEQGFGLLCALPMEQLLRLIDGNDQCRGLAWLCAVAWRRVRLGEVLKQ